nr:hypothetical protein [Tanacetum cinerariifolium]
METFKPVPQIIANADGTSTSTIPGPVITKEKTQKKNDVKVRSMLLMALPNEHLLTFSQYQDAKTLFEAIQARFSGNDATKKTQKTLLITNEVDTTNIQVSTISTPISTVSTHDNTANLSDATVQYKDAKTLFEALQARFGGNDAIKKTQRTLLKQMYENFNAPSTESLDSILKRLNKADLDIMNIDDLYNNFKNFKQEVKRMVTSSSSLGSHNMAFLSSPDSTNEVHTANIQVSTVSTPVSTVSSPDNTANLSDATVYAFLANQPNGSQLVHEDLEQIHEDDLEEMDLKWQLALLSMRVKRECKSPGNQEIRPRNQDSSRKTMNVKDTSSKAMVAIDGAGCDWSYMADDEVPTNMALMAFSDSEITCSCLNDVDEDLKDLAMCDFSYDALCTHWLGVTLLCSVSRFIESFFLIMLHGGYFESLEG